MNKASFETKHAKTRECEISIAINLPIGNKAKNTLAETFRNEKKIITTYEL